MNRQRAQEIVDSGKLFHVTYNNKPIYIQHIDENSNMARIYPLDDPSSEKDVPLEKLMEN